MSLTNQQRLDTKRELRENFEKTELTIAQIAEALDTTSAYIEQLMRLEPESHDHTWILRNFLYEKVKEKGEAPTEFTALKGNHRNYWFLDADYIEKGKIGRR